MAVNKFNLRGGVLIIGSLLWQDYLNKRGNDIRKSWRVEHLLIENKIMVRVPIRYGRLSSKDNIFTMTFAKSVTKKIFGTGYFVPFSKPKITTFDELDNEAKALSKAEGMNGNYHAGWGATLGILFNNKNVKKNLQRELISIWQTIISSAGFNHELYKLGNEKSCVRPNGSLNFSWPIPVDQRQAESINSYDFIIASVTQPTEYPSNKKLANNIRNDKTRYYFIENYKRGITTFQDIAIINSL